MDNGQWLPLLGSFVLGALLGAGGVFAWLSRRVKRDQQRVLHVEQARQLAAQQVTQARKQVEQLQRENHELRLAVRPAPRAAPAPAVEPQVDAAEAARLYAESKLNPQAAKEKPQAFKDTVVLRRSPD
ncbi:MAG: hypothetical protein HY020_26760 [Burkholderiales bacterium]|nr:hypothetical protein [Burkholderiales bacterium]